MTKKLFLTAASVAALAFAGGATAADLSVSLATVPVTVGAPYLIADVATGTLTGDLDAEATYTNAIPLANNLLVTLRLGGGATFAGPVSISDIDLQNGGVTIVNQQKTVSDGGQAGSNFVTFLVSTPNDAITSAQFADVEIQFAAGAKPTVAIETQTEFGTKIEGGNALFGTASAAQLVDYDSLVAVTVAPNVAGNATVTLDADPIFSQFAVTGAATSVTTATLGNIGVTLNAVYLPEASGVASVFDLTDTQVDIGAVDDLEIEYEGNFGGATGVALTPIGENIAPNGALQTVYTSPVVATLSGATSKVASEYKARVTVNFDDYAPYVTNFLPLSSIVRDGVSAEVPWVASSALAAKNATVSVIRVANKSAQPANVYVEHVTTASAQGLTPNPTVGSGVPVLVGSVSARSDLQIGTAALTNALGEFVRANVIVTIEAKENDVTVNNRISYADGRVEETTVTPR